MYIQLENVISDKTAQDLISIYKRKNDLGVINKKVYEFRSNWDPSIHRFITDYLAENIIPHARKIWGFGKLNYTNIKIREYPTGSFYEPHVDFHYPHPEKLYLSFSIILNNEFEGGELKIKDQIFDVRKSNAIVFQATDLHEVLKITEGFRMALIGHFIAERGS